MRIRRLKSWLIRNFWGINFLYFLYKKARLEKASCYILIWDLQTLGLEEPWQPQGNLDLVFGSLLGIVMIPLSLFGLIFGNAILYFLIIPLISIIGLVLGYRISLDPSQENLFPYPRIKWIPWLVLALTGLALSYIFREEIIGFFRSYYLVAIAVVFCLALLILIFIFIFGAILFRATDRE
jgi:hypothetical protein